MKKIYLTLITIATGMHFSVAQNTFPSSGNVGIGTTGPQTNLEINNGSYSNGNQLIVSGAEATRYYGVLETTVTAGSTIFSLGLKTNYTSILKTLNIVGSSVGISTTAPTSLLSLGPVISNKKLFIYDGGTEGSGFGQGSSEFRIFGCASGSNHISFGKYLLSSDSFTEQMRIDNAGNIGIGTQSPANKLDVQGGNASVYNTGNATSFTVGSNATGKTNIVFSTSADASGYGIIQSMSVQGSTYGNTAINPTAGNVLIGKTSQANSSYKLDVAGNVRANAVTVNATGADFVFEPAYHLNSLSFVENYINQNHHLPEIASAKEMQTNGLNLGDNQTKLLQKVEELTLYLIEQNKKINALQKDIEVLKASNQKQQK